MDELEGLFVWFAVCVRELAFLSRVVLRLSLRCVEFNSRVCPVRG